MCGLACHLSWMNPATAQCLVPGRSITFRSRATPFGQSRRNDAKELARFCCVEAASAGEPVPDALKVNRPRDPPASCVCSSISWCFRHSPPILIVCVAFSFVSVVATFQVFSDRSHGRVGAKPRVGLV